MWQEQNCNHSSQRRSWAVFERVWMKSQWCHHDCEKSSQDQKDYSWRRSRRNGAFKTAKNWEQKNQRKRAPYHACFCQGFGDHPKMFGWECWAFCKWCFESTEKGSCLGQWGSAFWSQCFWWAKSCSKYLWEFCLGAFVDQAKLSQGCHGGCLYDFVHWWDHNCSIEWGGKKDEKIGFAWSRGCKTLANARCLIINCHCIELYL